MSGATAFLLALAVVLIAAQSGSKPPQTPNSTTLLNATLSPEEVEEEKLLSKWRMMRPRMEEGMKNLLKSILPRIMRGSSETNLSGPCTRSILKVIADLRRLKWPALFLVDAMGKLSPGILTGRLTSFGAYDQCLDLMYPANKDGTATLFQGQYCTVEMKPPLPPRPRFHPSVKVLPAFEKLIANISRDNAGVAYFAHFFYFNSFRLGVCAPSTCSIEDIRKMAKRMEERMLMEINVPRCEIKEVMEVRLEQMIILCIFSVLACFVVAGTSIEVWQLYHTADKLSQSSDAWTSIKKVLTSFSLYSNAKIIMNTKMAEDTLTFLPGVRFLSVSWILLGHTYFTVNFANVRNLISGQTLLSDSFFFQIIINGTVSVDTFFFLSGLLVTVTVLKFTRSRGTTTISVPMFILRRAWRLLPGSMAILGLFLLVPWLKTGPMWNESVEPIVEECREKWWANMLFVNNLFTNVDVKGYCCLLHTWFISADFQLHVLSLVVLLPLLRWPMVGIGIAFAIVLGSCILSFILHYLWKFPPTMLLIYPDPKDMHEMWKNVYMQAWNHAGPYFIGVIAGYLLITGGHRKYIRNTKVRALGWFLATVTNSTILFVTYHWNRGNVPTEVFSLIYAAVHRPLWALSVAWIVLCCVEGKAPIVNGILSWKVFVPLSRLVFMIYLIHYPLMIIFNGMLYEYQFSHQAMIWWFFGHFCITLLLAFPACLLFESPFIRLEKLVMGKSGDIKPQESGSDIAKVILDDKLKLSKVECGDGKIFSYHL